MVEIRFIKHKSGPISYPVHFIIVSGFQRGGARQRKTKNYQYSLINHKKTRPSRPTMGPWAY